MRQRPASYPRIEIIMAIEAQGCSEWKQESGYHRRSIAETTMFRLKQIFSQMVSSRCFDNQAVELFLKCAALNRMIQIAKPPALCSDSLTSLYTGGSLSFF
jgi:hypothetical protein